MRMQKLKLFLLIGIMTLNFPVPVMAGNFDWLDELSIHADADRNGYRISLGTRFRIGDAEVSAVLNKVDRPGDAYMVFRLSEMSGKSPAYVLSRYQHQKGWGVLAKQLGIKPGSREFHALKNGHDLNFGHHHKSRQDRKMNKHKNKGKKK
jgi:hypothetical protein